MTSRGSAYARFKRALSTRNLAMVRAAAAELPQIDLDDALEICQLVATREPQLYERAALRWLARFIVERPNVTLAAVAEAADALDVLRVEPSTGRADLRRLLAS